MKKLLLLTTLCLLAASSFAQKPLSFFASQDLNYDDNIYLTDGDKKDAVISTTKAGLDYKANVPNSALNIFVNAEGAYNYYTEDSGDNSFWEALANVGVQNEYFKATERFIYTSDPANSELTDRAERIRNFAEFVLQTPGTGKLSAALMVSDTYDYYIEDYYKYLSRNRVNLGVQGHYNFSPKTSVFAEYVFSNISYKDNDDSDNNNHSLGLGINGQLASKVKGLAKVTYDMRKYKNDIAAADDDEDLFGYQLSLEWAPTTQNIIRLSGARLMEETLYGANRFYVSTGVSLFAAQKIMEKFEASITLAYENMKYDYQTGGQKRDDDFIRIRPALDYKFLDWLTAGVWYQYKDRSSNISGIDYDNNRAGAYVKAIF